MLVLWGITNCGRSKTPGQVTFSKTCTAYVIFSFLPKRPGKWSQFLRWEISIELANNNFQDGSWNNSLFLPLQLIIQLLQNAAKLFPGIKIIILELKS